MESLGREVPGPFFTFVTLCQNHRIILLEGSQLIVFPMKCLSLNVNVKDNQSHGKRRT